MYELSCVKDNWGRSELLSDWHDGGGVMIMGYEMFRNLSQLTRVKNKKQKKTFTESLLNPGKHLRLKVDSSAGRNISCNDSWQFVRTNFPFFTLYQKHCVCCTVKLCTITTTTMGQGLYHQVA